MFFLLRVAFWLAVVLALLPSGGSNPDGAVPNAMTACSQAGVRMLHDALRPAPRQTRPTPTMAAARSPAANPSQGSLTAADLAPAWRGPRTDVRKKHGA